MCCWAWKFGPFHLSIYSGDGLKLRGRRWLGDLNLQSNFFLSLSKLFLPDRMRAISSYQAPVPSWSMPLIFLEAWNQSILMWWVDPKFVKTWDIFKIRSCYIHQLCCVVRFLVWIFWKPWKSRNGPPNPKVSVNCGGEMFGAPTVWDVGGTRTQFLLTINNCIWFHRFVWYFDFRNRFVTSVPKFEIQDMWSPSVCWCIKALVLSMVPWQRHTRCLCFFTSNLQKKEGWKLA